MSLSRKKSREKYAFSVNGRASKMLRSAKNRAKKSNLNYELDKEWLIEKLKNEKCEMSGIKFSFEKPYKGYQYNPYSPSIDRHDPKKGYTKANSRVVITAYNIAKNQWNQKHFRKIMRAIVRGFK